MNSELVFRGGGHERTLTIVRHAQARAMRLSVDPRDATVRLSLPKRAALKPALAWASGKRDWVEGELARLPVPRPIADGATFSYAGDSARLEWREDASRIARLVEADDGWVVRLGGPRAGLEARLVRWLRVRAGELLGRETRDLALRHGITIRSVAVGDAGGRWGSCSSDGRIRYSWRLILAPAFVRRATVAHEVAHRIHMNHSPAFHAFAAKLYGGDPRPARAWLRANGAALHWFGRSS